MSPVEGAGDAILGSTTFPDPVSLQPLGRSQGRMLMCVVYRWHQVGALEMRYSLALAAIAAACLTLGALAAAIVAGGVGKNGSTVAVRRSMFTGCPEIYYTFLSYHALVRGIGKRKYYYKL